MADPALMHTFSENTAGLANEVIAYTLERFAMNPPPLDGPLTPAELADATGPTITSAGLGGAEALRLWVDVLAPACISQDHPRALSFVPSAPTEAAALFDLVVGASSIYAGSWLEGAGAVHAENEALRWLADLAGLGSGAGGCFVSGGSAGNLSALVAARHAAATARLAEGRPRPARWSLVASAEVHSSVAATARVMDIEVIDVPAEERGRLTGDGTRRLIEGLDPDVLDGVFALVATAGTTNAGIVDDL
ncbi:MAG TPA: pyridoxal-dependent decarboxylase, partial [Acidimicrobiales bacterium]